MLATAKSAVLRNSDDGAPASLRGLPARIGFFSRAQQKPFAFPRKTKEIVLEGIIPKELNNPEPVLQNLFFETYPSRLALRDSLVARTGRGISPASNYL
jgi:hypothetical protein